MKSFKAVAAAVTMLSVVSLAPQRSEALIAIATGPIGFLVGAAVFTGVALPVATGCTGRCGATSYVFWPLTALGIVLLDGAQGQTIGFSEIDTNRTELGTPAQIEAYNHALPYINAVRESIQGNVNDLVHRGQDVHGKQVHAMWESYRSMISPDAYSVLEKVSAQLTRK